jgi:hypothetical protein
MLYRLQIKQRFLPVRFFMWRGCVQKILRQEEHHAHNMVIVRMIQTGGLVLLEVGCLMLWVAPFFFP